MEPGEPARALKRELMEKLGIGRPAGVMLWGPLGVGITMLAEAAATEAGVFLTEDSGHSWSATSLSGVPARCLLCADQIL